jgi:CheY-like chemotaxis protein
MDKRKILIVDDDEAVLDFLQAKLGARYDIVSTNAPGNVLRLAREHRPGLILCDVDMPEMDGGDLSKALYASDELRHVPVLFLTGLATPEDLKRLSGQLGGRPAVAKGEPIDRLVQRIESLLTA